MLVREFFNRKGGGDLFGVELEMEGDSLPKHIPRGIWKVEEDGSLRGNDNAEYVFQMPLNKEEATNAFSYLIDYLEEFGEGLSPSRRTSTHIHVDCRTLNMNQLFNFIILLIVFEELLVDWCGEERKGNLFCLQTKDAEGFFIRVEDFLNHKHKDYLGDKIRYSAINLAALPKYGSVEVRSLRGTVDKEIFNTWLGVLAHLRKVAEVYDNCWDIVTEMSQDGPVVFSKKILGPFAKTFYTGRGRSLKVLDGIRRGQDIASLVIKQEVQNWFNTEIRKKEEPEIKLDVVFRQEY